MFEKEKPEDMFEKEKPEEKVLFAGMETLNSPPKEDTDSQQKQNKVPGMCPLGDINPLTIDTYPAKLLRSFSRWDAYLGPTRSVLLDSKA